MKYNVVDRKYMEQKHLSKFLNCFNLENKKRKDKIGKLEKPTGRFYNLPTTRENRRWRYATPATLCVKR